MLVDRNEDFRKFNPHSINRLSSLGRDNENFSEYEQRFVVLYNLILQAVEINNRYEKDIPELLSESLQKFIGDFYNIVSKILSCPPRYAEDRMTELKKEIEDFLISMLSGKISFEINKDEVYELNRTGQIVRKEKMIFITVYTAIKSFDKFSEQQEVRQLVDGLKENEGIVIGMQEDLKSRISESNDILEELRTAAAKGVASQASLAFSSEAHTHSHKTTNWWKPKTGGGAEKWLFAAISLLVITVLFIAYSISPMGIHDIQKDNNLDYAIAFGHVVILSLLIYLTRFSFKQFSIHKHLYTLNKHRENTLNSVPLLLSSIGKDDPTVRNEVVALVAKAIYDQRNTGYDDDKGTDISIPVSSEIPKMFSSK